jgi:hypothetical protein
MPQERSTTTTASGVTEDVKIMLLSDAVKQFHAKTLANAIIIVIPDTGKAKFSGSHVIASGKQAGKDSKATFIVAELGSSFAGVESPYTQSEGDVAQLPLSVKLSVTATPPNRAAKTIDEALNRKVELSAVPPAATGTNG